MVENKEQKNSNNDKENTFAIWFMFIGFIVVFCINVFK